MKIPSVMCSFVCLQSNQPVVSFVTLKLPTIKEKKFRNIVGILSRHWRCLSRLVYSFREEEEEKKMKLKWGNIS